MRSHEESPDAVLRRLRDQQDGLIYKISRGNAPPDNQPGGYMYMAGQVVGIDFAIALVREIFFNDRPEEVERTISERYGV